jgi:glycerophosphoryl diester phosphodiesterase
VTTNPVRISAHDRHRAHAETGAVQPYRDALAANADYVELDVRRTADAELVTF